MADRRTNSANAFETVLTAEFGPTSLTASLEAVLGLSTPVYLTFDPENVLGHREYIDFDGSISGTDISTTALSNRYLSGSVASSGITHPPGTVVRMTPTKQQFDDLHDRVEGRMAATSHTKSAHDALGLAHGSLTGLSNDDHPQYHTDARGDSRYMKLVGGTFTGTVTGVTPTATGHLATKGYVDGKVAKTGDTMTGALSMGNNRVNNAEFWGYREHLDGHNPAAGGTVTLDARTPVHQVTLAGNATIAFSNWAATGTGASVTMIVINGGTARTLTFPAAVKWPNGTVPTGSTGTDIYTFVTTNAGTTIYGFQSGKGMA